MSWLMVGMATAGLAKSELVDKPQAERQRKLAAATQMYSPWTGLKAGTIKEADPFGSALQFGATGAAMKGDSLATDEMKREAALKEANKNSFSTSKKYDNPWGFTS